LYSSMLESRLEWAGIRILRDQILLKQLCGS
jgi:hypothetical protein